MGNDENHCLFLLYIYVVYYELPIDLLLKNLLCAISPKVDFKIMDCCVKMEKAVYSKHGHCRERTSTETEGRRFPS